MVKYVFDSLAFSKTQN